MPLDFTAIDFETANSSRASACAVGLVKVRGGVVVDRAAWFIRPPAGHDTFSEWNTRVHGIVEADVAAAPTWAEQLPDLIGFVAGDPLVAHNARFDMGVIAGACLATEQPVPRLDYLCSLHVARRTYSLDSYKLPMAARAAGFVGFKHHDALADSEACAAIVVHAASRHGATSLRELAEATDTTLTSLDRPPATKARSSAPTGPPAATSTPQPPTDLLSLLARAARATRGRL